MRIAPRPYAYVCEDKSPLVRPFCRYVVRWFALLLPFGLPANVVTIGASACAWAALAAAHGGMVGLSAALMAAYMLYDHADGMHARRTRTTGPLGEYFDHFLDVFHGSVALLAMACAAGVPTTPFLAIGTFGVLLAGAATMVEQHESGVLQFGFIGPLESMLASVAFLGCCASPEFRGWLTSPCAGGLSGFDLVMVFACLGGLSTAMRCLVRLGRVPADLLCYAAAAAAVLVGIVWGHVPVICGIAILSLQAADYTGGVISRRVRGLARPWPDGIAPAVVLTLGLVPQAARGPVLACVVALLVGKVAWRAGETIYQLRGRWLWWNPATIPAPAQSPSDRETSSPGTRAPPT